MIGGNSPGGIDQERIFLVATTKNETKLRKTEKTWEKITAMKVTSVKMRYRI